ncbi:MAG: hypothetical protein C5B43_03345 [Verrucomicrobia bacterium]|nr:MAG: hypothetical protein C5B43_03345 [Verrucomicrobiota bacterium]
MHLQKGQLTKYPIGSLRELWHIAAPLMIMSFSVYAMIFADRMILSHFSIEAMNAAVVAGAVYAVFMFSGLSLSLIAEVFVGQHNGAGRLAKIGEPVWQMIWFAVMSIGIFWPAGLFLGDLFLTKEATSIGIPYYKILMLFGPAVPLIGALSAFHVGRGKTLIVTIIAASGNSLNLLLAYLFVFGLDGFIPSMGVAGAAIATGISQVSQVIVLFILFLRPKHRETYGTNNFHFNKKVFFSCLKIGGPNAVAFAIGIASWAFFSDLIASTGIAYMTALTICQNYLFLFFFIVEGMSKAVTTISSNLIGAKNTDLIPKLMNSALCLHCIIVAILAIPLIFFSDFCMNGYFNDNLSIENIDGLREMVKNSLFWAWIIHILNGICWIYMGQLTAAGDTKFTMYTNMISSWLFLVFPAYFFISIMGYSPTWSWKIVAFYDLMISALMYMRYRSEKWRKVQIIQE